MIGKMTIAKFLGKNNKAKLQPQKITEAENSSREKDIELKIQSGNSSKIENESVNDKMSKSKSEKIAKKEKTIEDSGFVNIGGQYYEVNQNSPSVDIMKKSLSFVSFK